MSPHAHLPRLPPECYRGFTFVHWSMTIRHRANGWLSPSFGFQFREILLDSLWAYQCTCPVYCLMPDHLHLVTAGWAHGADQLKLLRVLRGHLNRLLRPDYALQKQAYDHVLREEHERNADAIAILADYIAGNPVRAGLAANREAYSYTRSVLPGYPELDLWQDDFWERFWKITASKMDAQPRLP